MSLTLTELRARVRTNTGVVDTLTDAALTAMLNDTQRSMARRHNWRDLNMLSEATLTVGTYRYAFPSDMKESLGIRLIDGVNSYLLIEQTADWLDRHDPNPPASSTGTPSFYCVDGRYYEIYPRPDQAYTIYIRYTRWPTALSVDTDVCLITDVDEALIAGASQRAFESRQEYDDAAFWERRFEKLVREAVIQDSARPVWRPSAVSEGTLPPGYWLRPDVG